MYRSFPPFLSSFCCAFHFRLWKYNMRIQLPFKTGERLYHRSFYERGLLCHMNDIIIFFIYLYRFGGTRGFSDKTISLDCTGNTLANGQRIIVLDKYLSHQETEMTDNKKGRRREVRKWNKCVCRTR